MRITPLLSLSFAALTLGASAATVIPVTEVFGHNERDNYDGKINDMIIGSGMNTYGNDGNPGWPAGEGDPSTWTATGSAYQQEWQSQDLLDAGENPTNGKIGWTVFDLGSSVASLENLYIWHIRENTGRVASSFNVYVAETPTVGVTHGPTGSTSIDYDFSSGGWTLINDAAPLTGTYRGTSVIGLEGNTGRYVGIEILTNAGDTTRVGFAEVGITAIPEPSAALLGALGFLALLRRRR